VAFVNACELPEELYYDVERDVWARPDPDGCLTLGMTDPAQTRAGRIVHVRVRAVGKHLPRGRSAATVESSKWVGPFPMPVSGEIVAANPLLEKDPGLINRDTYGSGWIVRVRPSDPAELADLLTGQAAVQRYGAKIREANVLCVRCADPGAAGGERS
jgi:glycine cleavage system H protein